MKRWCFRGYPPISGFNAIQTAETEGIGFDSVNDNLNDSVNKTYLTIKAYPGIQRKRISELTGKSIPTIDRYIALLAKANLIEHRDSDKTGGYYVKI